MSERPVIALAPGVPAGVEALVRPLGEPRRLERLDAESGAALREAVCLVLAGSSTQVVRDAARAHSADQTVQAVAVVEPEERAALERSLLFAPGLGELWVSTPGDMTGELLARAAAVTVQRRRYRSTRRRVATALEEVAQQPVRRAQISDAFLAALLGVLPDPVLSLDEEDRVLSWNPAAERLLGVPRAEALGLPLTDLVRAEEPPRLRRLLEEGREQETHGELAYTTHDGARLVAEVAIAPVEAAARHVRSLVLHDVTEQRRAQHALEEQAAELESQATQLQEQAAELEILNAQLLERNHAVEEALESRSRFYAAMSHELRTPMNAIIGYNSLLLDGMYGSLADSQREALERGQRAAQHLLELVNDTLDLAKIEAGRIEIQTQDTAVGELLEELMATMGPIAETEGVELTVESAACPTVCTDPRRVRQIVLNLVSNALKYGRGRPVRVRCGAADGGGAVIAVQDQGTGLTTEEIAQIFDEFVQLGEPGGAGTGLGLTISRRLAERLGGSLEVTSAPGEGSTFTLRLPTQPALETVSTAAPEG
jgi:PAS domain S-box-containing protein